MSANFNVDKEFEEEHKSTVANLFLAPGTKLLEDIFYQKRGMDAQLPSGSNTEIKVVRWKGKVYTAITLETHSKLANSPRNTWDFGMGDGWMAYSEADYLLYAMVQEDGSYLGYLYEMQPLRKWFNMNFHHYPITDTGNRCGSSEWVTRCRVVYLKDVAKYSLFQGLEKRDT